MAGGNKRGMKTRTAGPPPPASDDVLVTEEEPLSTPWWRWQALTKIPTHLAAPRQKKTVTEEPPSLLRTLLYRGCLVAGALAQTYVWTLEISWIYGAMVNLFFLAVSFILMPD